MTTKTMPDWRRWADHYVSIHGADRINVERASARTLSIDHAGRYPECRYAIERRDDDPRAHWIEHKNEFARQEAEQERAAYEAEMREEIARGDGRAVEVISVDSFDEWTCLCGNTASSSGFYACLPSGEVVEPTIEGPWDEKLYVCDACGRIIDQTTGRVVGRRESDQ